jgi:deferrochelatase/peroxidase EfeB
LDYTAQHPRSNGCIDIGVIFYSAEIKIEKSKKRGRKDIREKKKLRRKKTKYR